MHPDWDTTHSKKTKSQKTLKITRDMPGSTREITDNEENSEPPGEPEIQ